MAHILEVETAKAKFSAFLLVPPLLNFEEGDIVFYLASMD
jgi:hypothetical protein